MDDSTHSVPTIRSASDEAVVNAGTSKDRSIRSASDEHAMKAGAQAAKPPRAPLSQPLSAMASQAARRFGQQPWLPKTPAIGEDQGLSEAGWPAAQSPGRMLEFANVLASGYGTVLSEAVTFLHQAVERQSTMMSSMLHARSPQDIVLAGNRYLLGGWQAFFEVNVRAVQAASRLADDARQGSGRPGT